MSSLEGYIPSIAATDRKKSLFLVINMAFADLMLGALSIPGFIFLSGGEHQPYGQKLVQTF